MNDPLAAATQALQAGDAAQARRLCRQALKRDPGNAGALHLMAVTTLREGKPVEAIGLLKKAAKRQPGNAGIHFSLGEAHHALRKYDAAVAGYQQALALRPNLVEASLGIAAARLDQGQLAAAEAGFRAVLAAQPRQAQALNGLGIVQREQGRVGDAVESWRQALQVEPGNAGVLNNLGLALRHLGRLDEAVDAFLRALQREPENATIRQNFAACLKHRPLEAATPALRREVERCFATPGIDTQTLIPAALSLLEADPLIAAALRSDAEGEALADLCGADFWRSELLRQVLETTFVPKPAWERLLTRLRALYLAQPALAPEGALVTLTLQCFNNEYVFVVSAEEEEAVAALRAQVETALADTVRPTPDLETDLARLAMYAPLAKLEGAGRLAAVDAAAWSETFRLLLVRQVHEPLAERALAPTIRRLAGSDDAVSAAVRAMYEENPYPRWMTTAARTPRPVATVLRTLFPRFDPPAMLQGPVKLLIAGCGTGKQAIDAATRYRDARVLAVDLSLASLSYALRQADSLGVANVDFRQGDILALGAMEDRFAVIECVGVLMAIAEPLAAWRILVDLLQPRGVMKLGLYSETARRHIVAVRDLIAAAGYPATPEGIRRCRQDLIALPPERPERAVLDNRDFYSLSTCRDLIFHVQEHRFTLPQIADALDALGLDFLGFELDNPTALAAYRAAHPEDTTMTDLAAWHAFEQANPETFTGMYQFWCQKR